MLAYSFLYTVPHNPIIKNIGMSVLSNKQKNENISSTKKDNNKKIKSVNNSKQYSYWLVKACFHEIIKHNDISRDVSNKNHNETPSTPNETDEKNKLEEPNTYVEINWYDPYPLSNRIKIYRFITKVVRVIKNSIK